MSLISESVCGDPCKAQVGYLRIIFALGQISSGVACSVLGEL